MGQRRAKGVERERSVVAAAAELIAEQGLADLRMSDVARRAGMSVGHVTYYFPSKVALLARAITSREAVFQAHVADAIRDRESAWDRLLTLVGLAAANGPRDPDWLLWFEVWSRAATDPDLARTQRELDDWWRAAMAQIVAEGVERGEFRCADPDRAVDVLSALTDGLSVRLVLAGAPMSRARLLDLVSGTARALLDPRQGR